MKTFFAVGLIAISVLAGDLKENFGTTNQDTMPGQPPMLLPLNCEKNETASCKMCTAEMSCHDVMHDAMSTSTSSTPSTTPTTSSPCTNECIPACICEQNYVRNTTGMCIHQADCPKH